MNRKERKESDRLKAAAEKVLFGSGAVADGDEAPETDTEIRDADGNLVSVPEVTDVGGSSSEGNEDSLHTVEDGFVEVNGEDTATQEIFVPKPTLSQERQQLLFKEDRKAQIITDKKEKRDKLLKSVVGYIEDSQKHFAILKDGTKYVATAIENSQDYELALKNLQMLHGEAFKIADALNDGIEAIKQADRIKQEIEDGTFTDDDGEEISTTEERQTVSDSGDDRVGEEETTDATESGTEDSSTGPSESDLSELGDDEGSESLEGAA